MQNDKLKLKKKLEKMEIVDLCLFAKALNMNIPPYTMNKANYIEEIIRVFFKKLYQENVKIGTIVAFEIDKVYFSGKIAEIHEHKFVIETKNKVNLIVSKQNVIWYKTGTRWPKEIFAKLKESDKNAKFKKYNR